MMLQRRKRPIRRGAALTEAAIVLPVFLTMALGTIDLGLAVFQNHQVSEASRQAARIASVHGSLAPSGWNGGIWGTAAYSSGPLNAASDIKATTLVNAGAFTGLNLANTTLAIQWPQGANNATSPYSPGNANYTAPGTNSVQVTVSSTWTPLIFYVFGNKTVTLSATSIMPIAH
jgi:Flp pilus assembly protein TadG